MRDFSPTCAVRVKDCEGWWLSGCVAQWQSTARLHKPGVLGSIPGDYWPIYCVYAENHLITNTCSLNLQAPDSEAMCFHLYPQPSLVTSQKNLWKIHLVT